MRGVFWGCWAGAAGIVIHLVTAKWRYKHWPTHTQLALTFVSLCSSIAICWSLWPILSDPAVEKVTMTGDVMVSLWLGWLATLLICASGLHGNIVAMSSRRAPPPKTAEGEKPARARPVQSDDTPDRDAHG